METYTGQNMGGQDGSQEIERSLKRDDFRPAMKSEAILHVLSRPSLSYWQDAWMRFKKNKQALFSMYLIVGMILFTVAGPWIWQRDPSSQDLHLNSSAPILHATAVVVEPVEAWDGVTSSDVPEVPTENIDGLPAVTGLEFVGIPSTEVIRFKWSPVAGAAGYSVYRNEFAPTEGVLGVPLGDVTGGNRVSYEDSNNIDFNDYYYTVVAKNLNGEESTQVATIKASVRRTLTLEEAKVLNPDIKLGEEVRLKAYPFGTDTLGRDLFVRMMHGGRISLFVGFFASFLYILLGVMIGGISGYYGGRVDYWLMQFTDFVIGLPFLLFMILLSVVFAVGPGESSITPLMIALVILAWTGPARLVRGQVLQLRESEFVLAARLMGATPFYLLIRHLVPNLIGVILVSLTSGIPGAIFTEAFLSFIGLGVAPPQSSWGSMCSEGLQTLLTHPHEFFFPAFFISLTVLAFNLMGDGLRDALDPRLRSTE